MGGKHGLTPLAAVAAGLLAGAVGTVCLDAVQYLKASRSGHCAGRAPSTARGSARRCGPPAT